MTLALAGTLDGGRIRTLAAPRRGDLDNTAALEVLLSWCRANSLPTDRMLDYIHIEIHEVPNGPVGRYEIVWREAIINPPGGRRDEVRAQARRSPLLVEPEGLLAGELTCGYVLSTPPPEADAGPLFYTCDQGIDPADGRHPGRHDGGPPDGMSGHRTSWPNEHPGEQAFQEGLPYVGDLTPDAAHALVLARLQEITDRRPRVDRRQALIAIGQHIRGLREIALRHEPHATRGGETVCNHDFVSATGLTEWPCAEVRDALAGIVAFAPTDDR